MKFKRIGRVLVCLLLVSALLINASPIKAKASAVGATAAITAASTVLSPAGMVVGATFIALGLAAAANPEGFQNMVDAGVSALESAGTWVKDGMVELLRTEDADGNASYYVDSGLMDDVRSWAYSSETVTVKELVLNDNYSSPPADALATARAARYSFFSYVETVSGAYKGSISYVLCYSNESPFTYTTNSDGNGYRIRCVDSSASGYTYATYGSWNAFTGTAFGQNSSERLIGPHYIGTDDLVEYISPYDVAIGTVPAQSSNLTDGTSARQWSEEYTDRGLKVYGGGSGNNNNDGKWFWPVVLVAGADLLAMSQADQWAGETPKEFDDYTTKEELEIVSRPEVEFAQGVELAPVTSPAPDTGGDTGSDTGTESGNQTDYTSWFERIIKGIEELPSKFESWIIDCKTAIEELPSKFADWFNSIVEKLSSIWETLKSIPQLIIDGFRQLLSDLFVPSPDYIPNKVNALHEKFPYLDTFNELGTSLKDFLIGLGVSPPIIYIDLGAARNSYIWGGRQIFIDLTWYAEYKPTMDFIISAFLWLWFAFRLWQSLPGILQGTSGMWGSPDPYIGFHSWKDSQQKLGSGDGTIYSGPVPVPPERRLGWGRGRGFTERRK